ISRLLVLDVEYAALERLEHGRLGSDGRCEDRVDLTIDAGDDLGGQLARHLRDVVAADPEPREMHRRRGQRHGQQRDADQADAQADARPPLRSRLPGFVDRRHISPKWQATTITYNPFSVHWMIRATGNDASAGLRQILH